MKPVTRLNVAGWYKQHTAQHEGDFIFDTVCTVRGDGNVHSLVVSSCMFAYLFCRRFFFLRVRVFACCGDACELQSAAPGPQVEADDLRCGKCTSAVNNSCYRHVFVSD